MRNVSWNESTNRTMTKLLLLLKWWRMGATNAGVGSCNDFAESNADRWRRRNEGFDWYGNGRMEMDARRRSDWTEHLGTKKRWRRRRMIQFTGSMRWSLPIR